MKVENTIQVRKRRESSHYSKVSCLYDLSLDVTDTHLVLVWA